MVSVKLSTVQAAIPVARPRPSEALGSGSRRMSSQKRMSVVGATPLRLANGSVISAVPAVERQSLSARKAPVLSTSPRPSSIISSYKEPGPSVVRSPPSARNIATPPPTSKIEELDEEEEEVRILSPTKKRSARPRILSDYGIEESQDDDGSANDTRRLDGSDDEEFDQLEDSELASTSASKMATSRSRNSNTSLVELGKEPSASGARKTTRSSPVRNLDGKLG